MVDVLLVQALDDALRGNDALLRPFEYLFEHGFLVQLFLVRANGTATEYQLVILLLVIIELSLDSLLLLQKCLNLLYCRQ